MTSSGSYESEEQILPKVDCHTLFRYYLKSISTFVCDIYETRDIDYNLGIFFNACVYLLSNGHKTDEDLAENVNQLDLKTILLALIDSTPANDFRDDCRAVAKTYRDMTAVFRAIHTHIEQIVESRKYVKLQAEIFYARCILFILENKLGDTKFSRKTPEDSSFNHSFMGLQL